MDNQNCRIGIIGLGVMGRNLLLNLADHGYRVAGYDKNSKQVHSLLEEWNKDAAGYVFATDQMEEFIQALQSVRLIMLLVPAGEAVDAVIQSLIPLLNPEDVLMDGGNSFYLDTERRQRELAQKEIFFLGIGLSGGEEGARKGPSVMAGGDKEAYEKVRPLFESIAARFADEPCAAYLGPGGAGSYVKMVHNGIEYGIMQLIAEAYDILKRGLGLDCKAIHEIYSKWNEIELKGFLIEAAAQTFTYIDPDTKNYLIEQIEDIAEGKGTGRWTLEEGIKLQEPLPTINAAVLMRDISGFKRIRTNIADHLKGPSKKYKGDKEDLLTPLKSALYAGVLLTYIQGMNLLQKASEIYNYQLSCKKIAQIWRGGCIIRSAILDQIMAAYQMQPRLSTLLLDPYFAQELSKSQKDLRELVSKTALLGIPIPALMATLSYYDAFRSPWLPANLIQAQRDYFGSHSYRRIDQEGVFHTKWI